MSTNELDQAIADLRTQVEAETTATASAITLMNGIQARIDAAVAEAEAKGATPEQLQAIKDLSAKIGTETQALADAVQANTPVTENPNP